MFHSLLLLPLHGMNFTFFLSLILSFFHSFFSTSFSFLSCHFIPFCFLEFLPPQTHSQFYDSMLTMTTIWFLGRINLLPFFYCTYMQYLLFLFLALYFIAGCVEQFRRNEAYCADYRYVHSLLVSELLKNKDAQKERERESENSRRIHLQMTPVCPSRTK